MISILRILFIIIITIVCLFTIAVGLIVVFKTNKYSANTQATIISYTCVGTMCTINFEYTVNNKKYNGKYNGTSITNEKYKAGQNISIHYNPENIGSLIIYKSIFSQYIGWIFFSIALIILICSWIWFIIYRG